MVYSSKGICIWKQQKQYLNILKAVKWSQNFQFCTLIMQPLGAAKSCQGQIGITTGKKVQQRVNLGYLPSWTGYVYLWSTCVYWDLLSFPMFIYIYTSKESLRTYIPIMLNNQILGWPVCKCPWSYQMCCLLFS